MKQFNNTKLIGWMIGVLLFSVGVAQAQTNTLTFDNGACGTVATCSRGTSSPGAFIQIDGNHFFFYENTNVGGQALTHMIVRDQGDASGGAFQQESYTRGNGFFLETNQSSIGQVTFRQFINTTGHVADVKMDALNLIVRGSGNNDAPATQLSVRQDITDPLYGLVLNRIVMTPRNPTAPASTDFAVNTDFITRIDQTMTGSSGFSSTVGFDVGQEVTPRQTY
jgi:hypothetical protein